MDTPSIVGQVIVGLAIVMALGISVMMLSVMIGSHFTDIGESL
jgi:hypothetical protein